MEKLNIKNIKVVEDSRTKVKLKVTVGKECFEDAIDTVYGHKKETLHVDGIEDGKVTKEQAEEKYGEDFFYEDASKFLMQSVWDKLINTTVEGKTLLMVENPEIVSMGRGKDLVFTMECLTPVDVVLNEDFRKIKVEVQKPVVTDADIEILKREAIVKNAVYKESDKPAEIGDVVLIDFEGSVDGEYFEGGTAEKFKLKLGTRTFVDGFEDQLVGHKAGEDVNVTVVFPEQYTEKLAGKEAVFETHIHTVSKVMYHEFNKDFVKSKLGFSSINAFKADASAKIMKTKMDKIMAGAEDEVMSKLAAKAEMEVDDRFVEEEITRNLGSFERNLSKSGMTLEQFLEMNKKDLQSFRNELKPAAKQSIKVKGVIDKISILENITASEEEIEAYITEKAEEAAKQYEIDVEYLKEYGRKNVKGIIKEIGYNKTLDLIRDTCIKVVD